MTPQIPVDVFEKIAGVCRRHRVQRLSLFGSRVRGDNSDSSDFDFIVDFFPDARIGLFEYAGMQIELEELLGKKVDLVTRKGLKEIIRDRVLSEAEVIYAG